MTEDILAASYELDRKRQSDVSWPMTAILFIME